MSVALALHVPISLFLYPVSCSADGHAAALKGRGYAALSNKAGRMQITFMPLGGDEIQEACQTLKLKRPSRQGKDAGMVARSLVEQPGQLCSLVNRGIRAPSRRVALRCAACLFTCWLGSSKPQHLSKMQPVQACHCPFANAEVVCRPLQAVPAQRSLQQCLAVVDSQGCQTMPLKKHTSTTREILDSLQLHQAPTRLSQSQRTPALTQSLPRARLWSPTQCASCGMAPRCALPAGPAHSPAC